MSADGLLGQAVETALANALPAVVERLAEISGPRAYSVHQVAERLDVSDGTVYTLIRDGHLATVPHLPHKRVAAATLEEFLAGHRNGHPAGWKP